MSIRTNEKEHEFLKQSKSFSQQFGKDYEEMFPVVMYNIFRILYLQVGNSHRAYYGTKTDGPNT